MIVSGIGWDAGEAVPLQRSQCGQLCLPPLEPHTQPLCRPGKCSTWYPGSGFQQESLTDLIFNQYLQQETTFSNIKIFTEQDIYCPRRRGEKWSKCLPSVIL